MKSKCNLKHNKRIDEIDYQDWMLVYFPIMRKVIKGHQKIFFYMSDMALFNSYILHITIYSHKRYIYILTIDINVTEAILRNVQLPDYKILALSETFLPSTILGLFPKNIDPTPRKKNHIKILFVINTKYKVKRNRNARSVK